MREVDHDPGGLSYGAVFFEPVPDAALVLGLDLGHGSSVRYATSAVPSAPARTSS